MTFTSRSSSGGGGGSGGGGSSGGGFSEGGGCLGGFLVIVVLLAMWKSNREATQQRAEVAARPETSLMQAAERLFKAKDFLAADASFENALAAATTPQDVIALRDSLYLRITVEIPGDGALSGEVALDKDMYFRVYADRPIELVNDREQIQATAVGLTELFNVHSQTFQLRSLDAQPQKAVVFVTRFDDPNLVVRVQIHNPLAPSFADGDIVVRGPGVAANPVSTDAGTIEAETDPDAAVPNPVAPLDAPVGNDSPVSPDDRNPVPDEGRIPEENPGPSPQPRIEVPRKIKDVRPKYPELAIATRIEGTVVLEATIGADGRVNDVRVMRSIPLLDDAASVAVRQWEYSPMLVNGVPTAAKVQVTVRFSR